MAALGWQELIPPEDCFRGEDKFRIDAYSEFMPPPRVGWKPYATQPINPQLFSEDDPFGWYVTELEETRELQPGLLHIAKQVLGKLARSVDGDPHTGIPKRFLTANPYWSAELAGKPDLRNDPLVTLLPLALSRTLDDKGRVRWTLFGSSEQGPGKAFWKSFYSAPQKEIPAEQGVGFFCRLLQAVYGETARSTAELHSAGFRILTDELPLYDFWNEAPLPSWTEPFLLGDRPELAEVKYLLTFRPYTKLPASIRKAYLAGVLRLLPFPGSLVFWGVEVYQTLQKELPAGLQIPLLLEIPRHRTPGGIRVPQSGYLRKANTKVTQAQAHASHIRNTFKRTHRWDKILRDADELALINKEDKMLHVIFSTLPDDISLYDKPMARNIQLWTKKGQLLLDGPTATRTEIQQALKATLDDTNATPAEKKQAQKATQEVREQSDGLFGYRFIFPAMRVGRHEVYWHRPLVAYRNANGAMSVLPDAPLGYLTAYDADKPKLAEAIELWPRPHRRPIPVAAMALHEAGNGHRTLPTILNIRKLFDTFHLRGAKPLPRTFARQLLTLRREETLDSWLKSLPGKALQEGVPTLIEPEIQALPRRRGASVPDSLTYQQTATRAFEENYWKTIASLAEGTFLNKNNADCVDDEITRKTAPYHERQLDILGDYLLGYYNERIGEAAMTGKALAGEIPFQWRTDLDYSWMGGWLKNQEAPCERDLLIMIPGQDRSRAVVMSDHYDTAFMIDRYYKEDGGCGARMAACGADDNHSATSAMMLAAPIFLEMSKKGKLRYDIWLIHLTGEEFPADCLGARALTQRLVERTLKLHLPRGVAKDLSNVEIQGLYVSDMIAHNNDRERDIFQISPGTDPAAMWLAYQAHIANEIWNESVPEWNKAPERAGRMRGRRSPHGAAIPEIAPFLALCGQVRPAIDPRSTLYNTDGQVFSDAGVPCVLFMENYDINRKGYHDTHDTMENIDLDYGAALCAITIESVACAATFERA